MSESCIFCRIATGDAPARTITATDDALAFLDANPLAPGHTLVIPQRHHRTLNDLPTDEAESVFALLHRLVPVVEEAVDADATTIGFNNGPAAGQEVPHVHGHIVPRFESEDAGGPIHAVVGDRPSLSEGEMDEIADDIAARFER